jgi:hypothetical protein
MKKEKSSILLQEKIIAFQNAIHDCQELKGLYSSTNQNGYNDYDDRCWSVIFHKPNPDETLNKETRLSYGFGTPDYSIIFLYDHNLGKALLIKGDFSPVASKDYRNICRFAQFCEEKNILIAQFSNKLMMYHIDPEIFTVKKIIDSSQSFEYGIGQKIDRVVFDKNGLNYFAYIDENGSPGLIKFDWEAEKMIFNALPGYMTRFGLIHCLFIKELSQYPIAVIGVSGRQKSDPDMGYSLFIQNGNEQEDFHLYNFKNEFFQSWTPNNFVFSEVDKNGYIQISVYANDLLLTRTTVPTNFNIMRKKS